MKTPRGLGAFTSERARNAFLTASDSLLDTRWPQRQDRDVATAFGTTRVMTDGWPGTGAAPFVLLSGGGGNSVMWLRYVGPLSRQRPVVAVDPVGEPGWSTQNRPVTGGGDLAAWMADVLTALDITNAHVVGCSYGGWTAIQHALHQPGRTATLTLLDPAGFGTITARLMRWVILAGLTSLAPAPVRHRAARWLRNATLLDDDVMRLARSAMSFRRRMPMPAPLTDSELAALTLPMQLLLGEHSALHDSRAVADRVTRLMPHATVEVIPGASHDVPMHSTDLVITRILEFARQQEATT